MGFVTSPAYVISKHGMAGLTRTADSRYRVRRPRNRVNAVGPGFIRTPLIAEPKTDPAVRLPVTSTTPR